MLLSVATNFDNELIHAINNYPVFEVYGKLSADYVGGGRASVMLGPLSKKKLKQHVATAHKYGIEFNYLLNSACLDNREFTKEGRKRIYKLLEWLKSIEVDSVTVAIPFILEFVKHHFPNFKVRVSVFAEADHVLNVKFWEELGADSITLNSPFVNREFLTLKKIRKSVSCNLQLLANNSCIQSCPFTAYHKVLLAHSSQTNHQSHGFYIDYCYLKCSMMKLLNPVNYIRSDWIRPEDLSKYEDLGYDTFKLTERNMPTSEMSKRVQAYSERMYDGNLLDLVQPFAFPETKDEKSTWKRIRHLIWLWRYIFHPWKIRLTHIRNMKNLMETRGMLHPLQNQNAIPVFVSNRKLNGFLENFPRSGCRERNCEECRYCYEITERTVTIDENYRQDCLNLYNEVFKNLFSVS